MPLVLHRNLPRQWTPCLLWEEDTRLAHLMAGHVSTWCLSPPPNTRYPIYIGDLEPWRVITATTRNTYFSPWYRPIPLCHHQQRNFFPISRHQSVVERGWPLALQCTQEAQQTCKVSKHPQPPPPPPQSTVLSGVELRLALLTTMTLENANLSISVIYLDKHEALWTAGQLKPGQEM